MIGHGPARAAARLGGTRATSGDVRSTAVLLWLPLFGALLLGSACASPRRPAQPFPQPQPLPVLAPPPPDPQLTEALARCESALREARSANAERSPSAFATLAMQRTQLVLALGELRKARAILETRIVRARAAARALAQSDRDRAIIGETLLDLDEGHPPKPAPKRLAESEPFKDATEASALLKKKREDIARVEAQIDVIDATFVQLGAANEPPTAPPKSNPFEKP